MTMNIDPMNTLMRFLPNEQRIIGFAGLAGSALGLARQQIAQNEQAQNILAQQQNLANTRQNFIRLEGMIQGGADQETIKGLLIENIERAKASGGNPIDSIQALNALQAGGVPELAGFMNKHRPTFEQLGLLPAKGKPQLNYEAIDLAKVKPESIRLYQQTGNLADIEFREGIEPPPKYLEALSGELRKSVGDLEEEARSLQSSFNKVDSLSRQVLNGDRTAAGQLVVAMAKIADPRAIVTDSDAKMVDSAANPALAAYELLTRKGVSEDVINAIKKQIDPLNPETMDVQGMRRTAQALLESNIPSIVDQYQRSKDRANEQLSEGAINSIFGQSRDDFFYGLSSMEFSELEPKEVQEQPAQVEQLDMTRQEAGSIVDQLAEELGF